MLTLRVKLALFVLLNTADFFATWSLLREGSNVCEGNPIACWWLTQHGWAGLAGFKAATVLLASVLVVAIVRLRPTAGKHLLSFGCATLLGVVLYSCVLLLRGGQAQEPLEPEEVVVERSQRVEEEAQQARSYLVLVRRLSADLVAGRCSLREAVTALERSENGQNPAWRARLGHTFRCGSHRSCFAANVLDHALGACPEGNAQPEVISRLAAEFRSSFGPVPPCLELRLRQALETPTPDRDRRGSFRPRPNRDDRGR